MKPCIVFPSEWLQSHVRQATNAPLGECPHLYKTAITPANETALRRNTRPGPAIATTAPASPGPTAACHVKRHTIQSYS